MYTVKRKEVIKIATDYKSFTNAELLKQIKEMQTELQKRENIEKERRWIEVRNILHSWYSDYGDIEVNYGEFYLQDSDDYSSLGEIYLNND